MTEKKNILDSKIIVFLFFFCILIRNCTLNNHFVDNCIKVLVFGVSLVYIFLHFFYKCQTKFSIPIIIFFVLGFFTTLFNCLEDLRYYLLIYVPIVAVSMYTENICSKKNFQNFNWVIYLFLALISINALTLIAWPNGIPKSYLISIPSDQYWFFLFDNIHIFMYLPALTLACVRDIQNKKMHWSTLALLIIITFCVFRSFSATSVVGYSIVLLYLLLYPLGKRIKMFNSIFAVIVCVAIFFGFIIFRKQEIFAWFIENVLHKTTSFTGRTVVWDNAMELIKTRPFFGYGFVDQTSSGLLLGGRGFTHAHNTFLDITFKGGFITLIPYLVMLILVVINLYKYRNVPTVRFLSIVLLSLLVMFNFESREDKTGLYIILAMCYCASSLSTINQEGRKI